MRMFHDIVSANNRLIYMEHNTPYVTSNECSLPLAQPVNRAPRRNNSPL